MDRLRDLVFGPGRAVSVLSLTQILSWGILIYPPVLIMPHLAADHGWSLAFGMAGFSIGLVTSGMLSPTIGHLIDRNGGNMVMSVGALAGALGLVLLTLADQATPQELRLKGSPSGKNYIGPPGPVPGEQDREIVSFDGRILVTRFVDKDAAVRYGNMVYVRCAPRA